MPGSPGSRGSRGSSGSLVSAGGNGNYNAGLGAGGSRYGNGTSSNDVAAAGDQADSTELTVEKAAAPRYPSTEDLLRYIKNPRQDQGASATTTGHHNHLKNAPSSGLPPSGRSSRSTSRDAVMRTSPPVAEAAGAAIELSSAAADHTRRYTSSLHPAPPIAIPVYGKGDKPVNIYGTLGTSGESSASLVQALTSLSKAPPPTGAQAARMTAAEEVRSCLMRVRPLYALKLSLLVTRLTILCYQCCACFFPSLLGF